MIAEELELPVTMQVLQLFEEATPEQAREDPHREEETRPARHPAVGIGREAAAQARCRARADGESARSPGMQHQSGSDPSTQMLRIGGDRA